MKNTTVPAQITTIEDKIAGSLSLTQMLLLAAPVLLSGGIFIILPPVMRLMTYKLVLGSLLLVVFGILAIRIKGKLLLTWLIVKLHYNLRPRFFIFDKNDAYLRGSNQLSQPAIPETSEVDLGRVEEIPATRLTIAEKARLETMMADPRAKLRLLTDKKGGVNVHITEIKQEG